MGAKGQKCRRTQAPAPGRDEVGNKGAYRAVVFQHLVVRVTADKEVAVGPEHEAAPVVPLYSSTWFQPHSLWSNVWTCLASASITPCITRRCGVRRRTVQGHGSDWAESSRVRRPSGHHGQGFADENHRRTSIHDDDHSQWEGFAGRLSVEFEIRGDLVDHGRLRQHRCLWHDQSIKERRREDFRLVGTFSRRINGPAPREFRRQHCQIVNKKGMPFSAGRIPNGRRPEGGNFLCASLPFLSNALGPSRG